jgi:hypothetical protein
MLKKVTKNTSTRKTKNVRTKEVHKENVAIGGSELSRWAQTAVGWLWSYIIFIIVLFVFGVLWIVDYDVSTEDIDFIDTLWFLVVKILMIIWMYKTYKFLHVFQSISLKHSSSWAIWWWIVPIANLIIPYTIFKDILKYYFTSHETDDYSDYIRLLSWWWWLYIIGTYAFSLWPDNDESWLILIPTIGFLVWTYLLIRVIRKIWSLQS